MCEVRKDCPKPASYFVVTNRQVKIPANEHCAERRSNLSLTSCGTHLATAVRRLRARSLEAQEYQDGRDGVTVRMKNEHGGWV